MDKEGVEMSISCDLATYHSAGVHPGADPSTKLVMQMVCTLDAEGLISSLLMQADTKVASGAPCGQTHKETSSAQEDQKEAVLLAHRKRAEGYHFQRLR